MKTCQGNHGESQYIFIDHERDIKSKLVKKDGDWFVAEWKSIKGDKQPTWFPWISGTSEFLDLGESEIQWAK